MEGKHKGKPCFILACGYTLNDTPWEKLDQYVTIGINRAIYAYHPTYWMFIDHPIVKEFGKKINLRNIGSQIVCWEHARFTKNGAIIFRQHKNRRPTNMEPKYEGLQFGNTTSFAAIHLAHIMGCNPLVFLGLDLCYVDGYFHFYDDDPIKMKEGPVVPRRGSRAMVKRVVDGHTYWTRNDLMRMERNIRMGCQGLIKKGIKVYNCSRETMLQDIPKKHINDVLAEI